MEAEYLPLEVLLNNELLHEKKAPQNITVVSKMFSVLGPHHVVFGSYSSLCFQGSLLEVLRIGPESAACKARVLLAVLTPTP